MSDNYIVINGKRTELTEEQLKALGIETRKNPFERVEKGCNYYRVTELNMVAEYVENCDYDSRLRECVNYFNNESFANQVALHQLFYRKLLKFAYDYGCEDNQAWNGVNVHWSIEHDRTTDDFVIIPHYDRKDLNVYFSSDEAAKRAGREVIKPFMKEHPDFVW